MARRSIWTGSISFGLVNIPVKMYTAVTEERVRFHMLHDQDKVRLQRKMVCPADGKEVHSEHIVKGYEVGPDQYVIVRQEELEALAPEKSRSIQITDFVDIDEIDPRYYDRPYYLLPGEHAAKPYRLLVEAMKKSKKVAVAKFVMRDREYLAAIRPVEDVLCIETMHYGNEVIPIDDLEGVPQAKVDEKELKIAQQLIDSLSTEFDPTQYKDEYNQRVMEMVEKKAHGEEIVTQAPVERKTGRAVNLMAALEQSLAAAKKKSGSSSSGATATKRRKSA